METVRTGLTLSVHFQHCQDWYKRVRMVLILSRQFCPDGFQTIRTVFKLSGRFSNCPDGFQTIRRVFKLSGWFSNCPDGFQTVWMVQKQSGRCQNYFDRSILYRQFRLCPEMSTFSLIRHMFCQKQRSESRPKNEIYTLWVWAKPWLRQEGRLVPYYHTAICHMFFASYYL